ncbi:hypothetical protein PN466_05625 [Roseofilum reptotaenium CS-1145]|uniref:Uncharacterized protein n=1 Tax=Roseofilum reptotaenium AO1-A TaxID=1925591 RepID=A0A1L9QPB7_9CYAN|nr:hypothetical protein [Roseofilum reptotaenium]MDB9516439.1 hypothetical protein [Roseofilum reptotaenium CS-1145]OJJ24437.1 hypothetical protein BI308_16640 [Roseofilum reptotaenium AO1-A]
MEEKLRNIWWHRLPLWGSKISIFSSVVLADGIYLNHWKKLAAYAHPISLILGFLIGWLHFTPGNTFTYSIAIMAILMAISSLGAGLGSCLLFGYAVGDFFLFQHPTRSDIIQTFLLVKIPLLLSYGLLSILLISIPLAAQGLRLQTVPRLKQFGVLGLGVEAFLQALIQSGLVFVWTQAVPILIRPVYTWQGRTPPIQAIQPLQENGHILALFAAILGAFRIFLEYKSSFDTQITEQAEQLRDDILRLENEHISLPTVIVVLLKAVASTAMLSGMLSNWFEAIVLAASMAGVLLLREKTPKILLKWSNLMNYIPVILRLIGATGLSYWLALIIIDAMWRGNSFISIIISTLVGIIVFSLLIPNPQSTVLEDSNS